MIQFLFIKYFLNWFFFILYFSKPIMWGDLQNHGIIHEASSEKKGKVKKC